MKQDSFQCGSVMLGVWVWGNGLVVDINVEPGFRCCSRYVCVKSWWMYAVCVLCIACVFYTNQVSYCVLWNAMKMDCTSNEVCLISRNSAREWSKEFMQQLSSASSYFLRVFFFFMAFHVWFVFWWFSARLQYLQCISTGDTAVLH